MVHMGAQLPVVLRGYDTTEVDELLRLADAALASGRETDRAVARQALRSVEFRRRPRGYAKRQVRRVVKQRLQLLSIPSWES